MRDLLRYCLHCEGVPVKYILLDDAGRCPRCGIVHTEDELRSHIEELEAFTVRSQARIQADLRRRR